MSDPKVTLERVSSSPSSSPSGSEYPVGFFFSIIYLLPLRILSSSRHNRALQKAEPVSFASDFLESNSWKPLSEKTLSNEWKERLGNGGLGRGNEGEGVCVWKRGGEG